MDRIWSNKYLKLAGVAFILFMVFYNLTRFPLTWYDEGSHLHVPKSLIYFGKYADYSSEGFRSYGPTLGVGPTILLPIALAFKIFGVGLLQARIVMGLYLVGAILMFFQLAKYFGGDAIAWMATALLITSRGIDILEYGRQVLGEPAGLLFILLAFWLWYRYWEKTSVKMLVLIGFLLGLSMITKNQYFLVFGPGIFAAWIANLIYYRAVPNKFFLIPGIIAGLCYVIWELILILFMGPSSPIENLQILRTATAGAAFVLQPSVILRTIRELLYLKTYLGWLFVILSFGAFLVLPRNKEGLKWGLLYIIIGWNLVWYIVASVGWIRYAFPALVLSTIIAAKFFYFLTDGFNLEWKKLIRIIKNDDTIDYRPIFIRNVFAIWFVLMVGLALVKDLQEIVLPTDNYPVLMAEYLDQTVPKDTLVETWEPEMGFLTDHTYHFPPQAVLDTAIGFIWRGGVAPSTVYDYVETAKPEYVLVGQFGRWVDLYNIQELEKKYKLIKEIGYYSLYQLIK
jgi:4-amino-4-deoxy-L-arabinose transferase-like glycosyltransferase